MTDGVGGIQPASSGFGKPDPQGNGLGQLGQQVDGNNAHELAKLIAPNSD